MVEASHNGTKTADSPAALLLHTVQAQRAPILHGRQSAAHQVSGRSLPQLAAV